MPIPSSLTLQYGAVLSTTLFKTQKELVDQISSNTAFLHMIRRGPGMGWKEVDSIGQRAQISLLHGLANTDAYAGHDILPIDPVEGLTSAFYDWRQAATPYTISSLEMKQNKGPEQFINLAEGKKKQSMGGMTEFFSESLMRGQGVNDSSSIATAYVSPLNGRLFIEPLFKIIQKDPTVSSVVGNIDQSLHSFWRNQILNFATFKGGSPVDSYALFERALLKLHSLCKRGPGGPPNLHLTDDNTMLTYDAAQRERYRTQTPSKADIPFDNLVFKGKPLVDDEHLPDLDGSSTTQTDSSGTWAMINTDFFEIQVEKDTAFTFGELQKPINQDSLSTHILFLGALLCSQRRKQGVAFKINAADITS